jgi:hypothetical protein
MLPALATLDELEARLGVDPGSLSGPDRARAQAALDDASALVREESRRDWVDTDGVITAPPSLVRVTLGAALRTFRNPDGEISQTAGPFSRTVKAADVGVYLTPAEIEIVRRYRQESTGLWTLRTTRGDDYDSTLYLDDQYGLELFPVGYDKDRPWL